MQCSDCVQLSKMSGPCYNRYPYTENDDCSTPHTASIFYFISTITAMVVLGSITLLFFCCIYYKRRRIAERLRNARSRGQQATTAASPVMYVWPGTADEGAAAGPTSQATHTAALAEAEHGISKEVAAGINEPVSCVIMAGEELPTHLAQPLPTQDFLRLDSKVDDERG